jgi:hypothetical protein
MFYMVINNDIIHLYLNILSYLCIILYRNVIKILNVIINFYGDSYGCYLMLAIYHYLYLYYYYG